MPSDIDDLSNRQRDELRGTDAGRDPLTGVRLMRFYEEREQGAPEDDQQFPLETPDDDSRPR